MAAESQVIKGMDLHSYLIPQKFILIMIQISFLIIVMELQENHIYWYGINENHSIYSSTQKSTVSPKETAAKTELQTAIYTFLGFLIFEFVMLLMGVSVMFSQWTFFQNFIHGLGCLFTLWFLLDSWQY